MSLRSRFVAHTSSTAIALAGYRAGALTPRAALTAAVVGGSVIDGFGGKGALLLGFFFTSGSGLNRLPAARQSASGPTARNPRQVVANGGIAALAGIGARWTSDEKAAAILAGSLAAATSDTWATEVGLQWGRQPRYVISGKRVAPGLSGGITPAGTLASVAGALALAGLAGCLYRQPRLIPAVAAGGLCGSILDSVLGELVQVKRRAAGDGVLTEAEEVDGRATAVASGWRWVDNDVVNLACTLTGGVLAAVLWSLSGEGRSTEPRIARPRRVSMCAEIVGANLVSLVPTNSWLPLQSPPKCPRQTPERGHPGPTAWVLMRAESGRTRD